MCIRDRLCNDDTLHLEPRQGTRNQARAYCMKEETQWVEPIEFGTWDSDGQGARTDLRDFTKAITDGDKPWELLEKYPVEMLKYGRHYERLLTYMRPEPRAYPQIKILWGPTGTGKTRYVYDNHDLEDIFRIEPEYKWFDGYFGQKIVLFDEYKNQFTTRTLLQLIDRHPMRVAIKGGFAIWKPELIYFTSNIDPSLWYKDAHPAYKLAFSRRVTQIIYMDTIHPPSVPELLPPPPQAAPASEASLEWDAFHPDYLQLLDDEKTMLDSI